MIQQSKRESHHTKTKKNSNNDLDTPSRTFPDPAQPSSPPSRERARRRAQIPAHLILIPGSATTPARMRHARYVFQMRQRFHTHLNLKSQLASSPQRDPWPRAPRRGGEFSWTRIPGVGRGDGERVTVWGGCGVSGACRCVGLLRGIEMDGYCNMWMAYWWRRGRGVAIQT